MSLGLWASCGMLENLGSSKVGVITLSRSITVFSGTDSILWNIPHMQLNVGNILQNTASPREHCYKSEQCYGWCLPFYKLFIAMHALCRICDGVHLLNRQLDL